MTEKQDAIDACSCPRTAGEVLVAPLCPVELDIGDRHGPVLVSMPLELDCPMARQMSYGEFCTDQKRIRLHREFGV